MDLTRIRQGSRANSDQLLPSRTSLNSNSSLYGRFAQADATSSKSTDPRCLPWSPLISCAKIIACQEVHTIAIRPSASIRVHRYTETCCIIKLPRLRITTPCSQPDSARYLGGLANEQHTKLIYQPCEPVPDNSGLLHATA